MLKLREHLVDILIMIAVIALICDMVVGIIGVFKVFGHG